MPYSVPSPPLSLSSSSTSSRSSPVSSLRSTATLPGPSTPPTSSTLVRLPPINSWFRPGFRPASPSHLSTPLNQLKIAQPLSPWSSPLTSLKSDLGSDGSSNSPSAAQSLLPVATQVPSQARMGPHQLYHSERDTTLEARQHEVPRQHNGRTPTLSSGSNLVTTAQGHRARAAEGVGAAERIATSTPARLRTTSISASSVFMSSKDASSHTSSKASANNVFAGARTQTKAEYSIDGQRLNVAVEATSHDCFTLVSDKWTCYRRNYLKIDALARTSLDEGNNECGAGPSRYDGKRARADTQFAIPVPVQMRLSAHVADQHGQLLPNEEEVSLIQFGPEREQGPRTAVEPVDLVLAPGTAVEPLSEDAAENWRRSQAISSHVASFRRIQIRRATSNNGRTVSGPAKPETRQQSQNEQQYLILRIAVYIRPDVTPPGTPPPPKRARLTRACSTASSTTSSLTNPSSDEGEIPTPDFTAAPVLLATLDSAPVTIRGRSRKHFAEGVSRASAASPAPSSTGSRKGK